MINILANNKKFLMVIPLYTALLLTACGGSSVKVKFDDDDLPLITKPDTGVAGDGNLEEIVRYVRQQHDVPAMAAIMVHDGEVIEQAVSGNREYGKDNSVTLQDKWHVGSITKSMTSTLAAQLVQQGVLEWETTIGDVYAELKGTMRTEYEDVTLTQLLSHTSGMRANLHTINDFYGRTEVITEQRQQVVEQALILSTETTQGNYLYSNLGYMVAGAMMEKLTGMSWESLMEYNLFSSLDMADAGFGAPDIDGDVSQPLGHERDGSSYDEVKVTATTIADNPELMRPAGRVHASLADMGKYLAAHLQGARGEDVSGFLTADDFSKLHTPVDGSNYALGWISDNGRLHHNGSNTMWLAQMLLSTDKNTALYVVVNAADLSRSNSVAQAAVSDLLNELAQRSDAAFD